MAKIDPVPQTPRVGVAVIIIRDGLVLVGKRKGAHGEGSWAVPGGNLQYGETPEMCARREVLEETGLILTHTDMLHYVTNTVFAKEGLHYITLWVVARLAGDDKQMALLIEPDRCHGWEWSEWGQIPEPQFLPLNQFYEENPFFSTVVAKYVYPPR